MRFDVRVNSKPVCIAGIDPTDQGVLSVDVSLTTKTPTGDKCDLFIHSAQIDGGDLTFGLVELTEGDEIVIRVIPSGKFDTPQPAMYVDPEQSKSMSEEYEKQLSAYNEADREFANKERKCPRCNKFFVSTQNRGQCPECRLVFLASHPMGDQPW